MPDLYDIERAIWNAHREEHPEAEHDPDHWPNWLIGAALAAHEQIEASLQAIRKEERVKVLGEVRSSLDALPISFRHVGVGRQITTIDRDRALATLDQEGPCDDSYYLCFGCEQITHADKWTYWQLDEGEYRAPRDGDSDSHLKCPNCGEMHGDNYVGDGLEEGTRAECEAAKAKFLTDPKEACETCGGTRILSGAERPKTLTLELAPQTIRWLDKHPQEWVCVEEFVAMMVEELAANDGKGNRPGWLTMSRKDAIAVVHWHASKLAVAAKEAADVPGKGDSLLRRANHDGAVRQTREFAADTANCALMVLDCMGLLSFPGDQPSTTKGTEQ
jgi:hypothetical protein